MLTTKRLGQSDLHISPLGLGTVKLGRDQQVKYPEGFVIPDDIQAAELIAAARDQGINFIDTAPAYGTSEERLGKLLNGQRSNWIISTKAGEDFDAGVSSFNFTPKHIRSSIERSLRRLRSDYLDLVLIHSDGNDREIIERYEVFDVLAELKRAGWLRAYGMSTKTIEGGLMTAEYADAVMVTYNLQTADEVAVIDKCLELNKGVLLKKALASGHICKTDAAESDPIQDSMNFIFSHPGVTSAIVGTINPDHLRDNVRKAFNALSQGS